MRTEVVKAFLGFHPKLQEELIALHPELKEYVGQIKEKRYFANWGAAAKSNSKFADWKTDILAALELRPVMEFYGVLFDGRGFTRCPFHTEKTASLSIKGDRFKCFGCGESGNAIDFTMKYLCLSFREAMIKLDSDFNLGITGAKLAGSLKESGQLKQKTNDRNRLKQQHEAFKRHYLSQTGVYQYLFKSIRKYAPEPDLPREKWHPVFVYAVDHLPGLENWLDQFLPLYSDITLYQQYLTEGRGCLG